MKVSMRLILIAVAFTVFTTENYAQVESLEPATKVSQPPVSEGPVTQAATSGRQRTVQPPQNAIQSAAPEQLAAPAQPVVDAQPAQNSAQEGFVTRIFQLRMANAKDVIQILRKIFSSANVITDDRANSIIFVGTEEDCGRMEELLQKLDTEISRPEALLPANIAYRVFAVEVPIDDANTQVMKNRFQVELLFTGQPATTSLLEMLTRDNDYIIEDFDWNRSEPQISISGWTNSPHVLKKIAALAGEILGTTVEVKEINYSNPSFGDVAEFPSVFKDTLEEMLIGGDDSKGIVKSPPMRSVQRILANLLGEKLRIHGYWFGNTSIPGKCEVPIGSWTLSLESRQIENSGQNPFNAETSPFSRREETEFQLQIRLDEGDRTILYNTIKTSIGKPVVVGYTRRVNQTFIPGALVIIPENEFTAEEKMINR